MTYKLYINLSEVNPVTIIDDTYFRTYIHNTWYNNTLIRHFNKGLIENDILILVYK